MAQAAKNRNSKSFVGSIEELRTEAVSIGAFEAHYGKEKNALGNLSIANKLDNLRGAQRKNAEAILVAGYNEGYEKALAYFESL